MAYTLDSSEQRFLPTYGIQKWVVHNDGSVGMVWSAQVGGVEVDWVSGPRKGNRLGVSNNEVRAATSQETTAALSGAAGMDLSFAKNNPLLSQLIPAPAASPVNTPPPPTPTTPPTPKIVVDTTGNAADDTDGAPPTPVGSIDELETEVRNLKKRGLHRRAERLAKAWYARAGHPDPDGASKAFVNSVPETTAEEERVNRFEGSDAGRAALFTEYLQQQNPNYSSFTPEVRSTLQSRRSALEDTYQLDPQLWGDKGKTKTFEQFLGSGQEAFSPEEIEQKIGRIASLAGPDLPRGSHDAFAREYYMDSPEGDERAFSAVVGPYLNRLSPSVRETMRRIAERDFGRMRAQANKSFVQQLGEMGGRYWGQ